MTQGLSSSRGMALTTPRGPLDRVAPPVPRSWHREARYSRSARTPSGDPVSPTFGSPSAEAGGRRLLPRALIFLDIAQDLAQPLGLFRRQEPLPLVLLVALDMPAGIGAVGAPAPDFGIGRTSWTAPRASGWPDRACPAGRDAVRQCPCAAPLEPATPRSRGRQTASPNGCTLPGCSVCSGPGHIPPGTCARDQPCLAQPRVGRLRRVDRCLSSHKPISPARGRAPDPGSAVRRGPMVNQHSFPAMRVWTT